MTSSINELRENLNKGIISSSEFVMKVTDLFVSHYGHNFSLPIFINELGAKDLISDRRSIYSVQVTDNMDSNTTNKHWRWAGNLEQFKLDAMEYCCNSGGHYSFLSKNVIEWRSNVEFGKRQNIIVFQAVKQ